MTDADARINPGAGMSETWGSSRCPILMSADSPRISLAHGEGARLSRRLIADVIHARLYSMAPNVSVQTSDAAHVESDGTRLAICTDSHTVTPLFFPGGDLGSLAIFGTVNDLAVSGARPRWLTMAMIIEEGLPLEVLERILDSAAHAARQCQITIVAGDTKVVPRGAVDGLFINTSGVGELLDPVPPGPKSIQPGDRILVSGSLGNHGIAILGAREQSLFSTDVKSDSGCLLPAVTALRESVGTHVRAIRDATRGGVSAVLHEWAEDCGKTFALRSADLPVRSDVRGACELLGLDPIYVANECVLVTVVDQDHAFEAVHALRSVPGCESAAIIGEVQPWKICPVTMQQILGPPQPLDEPAGALLPRIC